MNSIPSPPQDKVKAHAEGCKILKADPGVQIEWIELERGHWRAQCACGSEDHYERDADRPRLDPFDPKTARHAGECEFASVTDVAVLRLVLKVRDGLGGRYHWVTCGSCDCSWQAPHFAERVG